MDMVYAYLLLLAALAFFFIEFFVPSFGILTLMGGAAITGGVLLAFKQSTLFGFIFIVSAVPFIAATVLAAFKLLSRSPMVEKTELNPTASKMDERMDASIAADAEGVVLTTLRPIGMARFGEKRIDVSAESGSIEKGARVRIIRVEGPRIVVRKIG